MRGTVQGTAGDAAQARLETASPHQPRRRLVIGVAIDVVRARTVRGLVSRIASTTSAHASRDRPSAIRQARARSAR